MHKCLATAALATLMVVLPLSAQTPSDDDEIRSARARFNDAIARHDVTAIVSFLDEDYQITTSLGQMFQGREDEADVWAGLFESRPDVVYVRTPVSIEVSEAYPLAAETGHWVGTWTTADGPVRTGGSYSAMWRRVDDNWKVRSELFVALYCEGVGCP